MLYRPVALAVHHRIPSFAALRSLATGPFREGDNKLNHLLGVEGGETSTASLWGDGKNTTSATPLPEAENDPDPALVDPPKAPEGSYPAATTPAPRTDRTKASTGPHALPTDRHFHLHVLASRNNTILTFTNHLHNTQKWVSAGLCGFKKVQRSGYEAGYQCAVRMFAHIAQEKSRLPTPFRLDVAFKGYGFGREAVFRALMASEGDAIRGAVVQLKDATPLKVGGGTKAKKTRRL